MPLKAGIIAVEEAFNLPRLASEAVGYASPTGAVKLERDMVDILGRVKEMDEQGVELQILSFTSPGPQSYGKAQEAEALARESNDWIANEIKGHENRFAVFASVSMIRPEQAAAEARRCIEELKFVGVIINDYQNVVADEAPSYAERGFADEADLRLYYDDPAYDVFWKTMQELDRPVYLHPRLHLGEFYKKRPHLAASAHGFKTQLSSHVLAITCAGVFDRFPKLQLAIGHMGEGLTNDLWRTSHKLDKARFPKLAMAKNRILLDYFRSNIHITTSGHYSNRALLAGIAEVSSERIMFAVDYPYEPNLENGCRWIKQAPISDIDRLKVARTNAIKLFHLDAAPFKLNADATVEELSDARTADVYGIDEY